jgi:CotH kinase protein
VAIAYSDGLTSPLGANNFYVYQPQGTTRFVFLPWDRDFAFSSVDLPIYDRVDTNVLTSRLLALPQVRAEFRAILGVGVEAFVTDAFLSPRLEDAYTLIRPSVLEQLADELR